MRRRTKRLLLRPLRHGDEADVLAYRGRADVCRYLPNEPLDATSVTSFVAARTSATRIVADGDRILLAVERDGRVIGDVRLRADRLRDGLGEIGWVFHPDHHRCGYATEAGRELLRLAFDDLGLRRVWAEVDPRNVASARVCGRLGMRPEGQPRQRSWLRGHHVALTVYGILGTEWRHATG